MSDKKPMILFLAGPNGSGKSTITQFFDIVGTYTNADDMVLATGMSNEEAAIRADEMRYKSIEKKEDLLIKKINSIDKPYITTHVGKDICLLKEGYYPMDYNSSDKLIKKGIYFKLQ